MTTTAPTMLADVPALPAVAAREQVMRSVLFVATFLLIWITTAPFADLADSKLSTEGNFVGQLATLALTATLGLFIARRAPHIAVKAVTPILILTLFYFALSAFNSNYPDVVIRRVILAMLTIVHAAILLLLAPNRAEFARLIGLCSLVVLGLCFGGVGLIPDLAIHQSDTAFEPGHAGSWRGFFESARSAKGAVVIQINRKVATNNTLRTTCSRAATAGSAGTSANIVGAAVVIFRPSGALRGFTSPPSTLPVDRRSDVPLFV